MSSSFSKEEDNAPSPSFVAAALPAVVLLVCTFSLFVFLWQCRWRRRWMGRSRSRYRCVRPCPCHCTGALADGLQEDVEMGLLPAKNDNWTCTWDRGRGREDGGGELGFVDGGEGRRGYGSDGKEDDEDDAQSESEGFSNEASSESSTFALASESESESDVSGESASVAIVRVPDTRKCRARTRRRSRTSEDGGERIRRRRMDRKKGGLGVLDGFLDRVVERVVRFMDEGDERGGEEGVRRV